MAKERDFTPEEALEEARKRWPTDHSVVYDSSFETGTEYRVEGGFSTPDDYICEHGMGPSFRAAFAAADKNSRALA